MKRDAKEEVKDLFIQMAKPCSYFNQAKQCAIISQQRILELDVWNCNNEEELNFQREILKELEKL